MLSLKLNRHSMLHRCSALRSDVLCTLCTAARPAGRGLATTAATAAGAALSLRPPQTSP